MSCSLNSLKGGYIRHCIYENTIRAIKGILGAQTIAAIGPAIHTFEALAVFGGREDQQRDIADLFRLPGLCLNPKP